MFLHCHSCGWQQDDYQTKHYEPRGEMAYRTLEDRKRENPEMVCPRCKKPALDED